jgi:predicted nucleic acid-binding Zn ribbon protein
MALVPLRRAVDFLSHEDTWKSQRQFQQVVDCWPELVGAVVAAQTRPYAIQRQTLQVGASSAVWAQTLMFERIRILEKLNACLDLSLSDIRFSTVYWYSRSEGVAPPLVPEVWSDHPSRVGEGKAKTSLKTQPPADSGQAFQQWSQTIQSQCRHLPLCPKCQCPTPEGELRRWSVCSHCISQSW